MYLHPDHPRKETILAARDHLLAENPKLRVVGAHLGSMETDVDEIAKRFDRYPNFAVDTAARMEYLMLRRAKRCATSSSSIRTACCTAQISSFSQTKPRPTR